MANEIQVFNFNDAAEVRTTIDANGEIWFVASDVCAVLEHSNVTMALQSLDEDQRAKQSLGRAGETNIISESGLYTLVLRSNKPQAKPFQKWVTKEVLPTIRKTGEFKSYNQSGVSAARLETATNFEAMLKIARLAGFVGAEAVHHADFATTADTGVSPLALLQGGRETLKLPFDEVKPTITVTKLGELLGVKSGQAMNAILTGLDLQKLTGSKCPKYQAVGMAKEYSRVVGQVVNGRQRGQLEWMPEFADVLRPMLDDYDA